ncbi:MAG: YidC/Oxa1 family membrane protein insertase [Clostridiales bacterium]|nr:YidC/Oxa1 family membrane protein insertase [Clostridiales bacterium]MDD7035906.1 YidC/Oxa1 family membrane protein insertase [Bacillota bacterium]MDY2920511.1 YidC/Oxa1 family membrane protein insertase [Lentihominibacter sp.]
MYTILGVIAKPMGYLLDFLYNVVGNYGITIIIFTVFVKLCIYPLYIKQTKSTAVMSEMQPKIREIQNRYANDQEMMNIKLQELYKEEKFNPMGGCLPMLIQMPIIMGLFALLRNPLRYITKDDMIFAFHEPFLWIDDLSQPDPWVLPIIAGVATFIAFTMNRALQDSGTAATQQSGAMMKMMQYIFPIMILWMAKSFPSGLALYWAVSQIIQIFFNIHMQTMRKKIKREQEEKRIREKIEKKNRR